MSKKKFRILIIEDDDMLREMYVVKFEKSGFEVAQATEGAEGLDLAKKQKPDIILLDIILPKIDGFMVLQAMKDTEKLKEVPVMLLTNLGQESDRKRGEILGAVDYVVKSNVTPAQVEEKIRKILK
ncbi:MAG: response regulator [Parcubacteria group bacterium CG08_land_8_20_14_0_20_48_21]|nr:MAG: hypothetical protein AUK21_04190 [Parcubacteria group bacterium CG2_30_48_51]PIS33239.1 MAG: response regulator [Parcubacteria group bacterium CG08_land_8_20_14_0_20_48_21]PIW79064.1 MAG: response regulator [Parcubacteria group bacterium CG_4_8_14_3_um_filter_48_16]PIY78120.1 MAG: response regulator [Parcubacteria group bacterium CG_4_10_14_0_8_um_filter_48_154]PIZ77047.1 MAG: response regulator [bacterium CG_4_10_14_0_2_um_filter_48_144]PJC39462.1 MAG: response regulator [Parcubacteri